MHKFSEDWRGADAWEGLEKLDELDGEKLDDREEKLDELDGEKLLDREKEDDEEGEKLDRELKFLAGNKACQADEKKSDETLHFDCKLKNTNIFFI